MQGVKNGKRRMKNVHQKETTTKRLKQGDSSAISKASVAMPVGAAPMSPKLTIKLPAKYLKTASSLETKTCSSALPNSIPIHSQVALTSISGPSPVSFTSVPSVSIPINSPRRSSLSNFINVPTEPHININQVNQTLLSEAKYIHQYFVQGTTIELHDFKRMR